VGSVFSKLTTCGVELGKFWRVLMSLTKFGKFDGEGNEFQAMASLLASVRPKTCFV
jgi:hypothetical protein